MVVDEAHVDRLEPTARSKDGSSASGDAFALCLGVYVGEGNDLHGEPGMILVVAMWSGIALRFVAGVHVEDKRLSGRAQSNESSPINHHHVVRIVDDLSGLAHRNGMGGISTVKDDHSSLGYRRDHCLTCAALGGAVAHHRSGL